MLSKRVFLNKISIDFLVLLSQFSHRTFRFVSTSVYNPKSFMQKVAKIIQKSDEIFVEEHPLRCLVEKGIDLIILLTCKSAP